MIHAEKLTDQTYKFLAGKTISESEMTLTSPQEALNSPIGKGSVDVVLESVFQVNIEKTEIKPTARHKRAKDAR